jgi:hypothetical protein
MRSAGRVIVNIAPSPGGLAAVRVPPCVSTSDLAIGNPSPDSPLAVRALSLR